MTTPRTPAGTGGGLESLQETLAVLATALDQVNTSADLSGFLADAKVFWRYSASNILLLSQQAKERGIRPSLVAGYREWEREGRYPQKGSRSLRIIAPAMSRGYQISTPGSSTPTVVYRKADIPAGSTVIGQTTGRARYTVAHVFDLSQTVGTPILRQPPMQLTPNHAARELQAFLTWELADAGFTVKVSNVQYGTSSGHTDHVAREVVIPGWMYPTDRVAVLAHEYAHVMLHGPEDPLARQYSHNTGARGLAEVEAEATAYLILAAHGIDSTERSADYLAGWSDAVLDATREGQRPAGADLGASASRSDVVRGALSRICGTAKTALLAMNPPTSGGKPVPVFAGIDAEIASARTAATGPVITPDLHGPTLGRA